MRGWLGIPLIACFVLAGCATSGSGTSASSTDPAAKLSEVDAKVTATTGAIKGVVVDSSITPVPGAKVSLAVGATNKTVTADKEGRFVFSDLAPGTYFLTASAPLYHSTQTSIEVKAGEPSITKIQIQPLFSQKPYSTAIKHKGFFECSQSGIGIYSSSNCVTDPCPAILDTATCNGLPNGDPGKPMDTVTSQEREWHADVGPGWQVQVFEMTWTPSAQGTSPYMGMVVSTYKPERNAAHSFANVGSANPMRFELDVGKKGPGAASVEPVLIPAEGMSRMSFFCSVRGNANGGGQAVALNQDFQVFLTQFYYGIPPDGWSFVKGDEYPF